MNWSTDQNGNHIKELKSDSGIMRKFKALGINKDRLVLGKKIIFHIPHRSVTIWAKADDVLAYNLTTIQNGEKTYHYPLSKWKYEVGDTAWYEKIKKDFGWSS